MKNNDIIKCKKIVSPFFFFGLRLLTDIIYCRFNHSTDIYLIAF